MPNLSDISPDDISVVGEPSAGKISDHSPSDVSFAAESPHAEQFGSGSDQLATAATGALNTATGGLFPKALSKTLSTLGIPEDFTNKTLLNLREENPGSYGVGQVGGLLAPIGEAIGAAGKGAEALVGSGIAGAAARTAIEGALFQTTDEVAKRMMNDPDQTLQTAAVNVGLSGLLTGAFGAVGGILGKGVAKVADTDAGEFLNDFRNRVLEHVAPSTSIEKVANPDYLKIFSPGSKLGMYIDQEVPKAEMSYKSLTAGQKAADAFMKSKLAGQGLGAAAGEIAGHSTGIPFAGMVGAGIGAKVLGPALDAIIKPVIRGLVSGGGFKAAADMANSVIKGDSLIANAAKSVFDRALDVLPAKLTPDAEKRDTIRKVLEVAHENPQAILNVGGPLDHYLPNHSVALGQLTANAIQYLQNLAPKPSGLGAPLDSRIEPSKAQQAKYNRALDIAQQPLQVVQHIKDGTLLVDDLKTFSTLYPKLHQPVAQALTNSMIEHMSKGESVPYRVRTGLSLFTGQPLDSTMSPQALQAIQALYAPKQPPQQGPAQKAKKNTAPLSKVSSQYETAEQSRESRRNK